MSPNTTRIEKTKQKFFSVGKKTRKPAPQVASFVRFYSCSSQMLMQLLQ